LRRQENNGGITMVMTYLAVRAMVVMVALAASAAAILQVACENIRKMSVVMGVIDAVHQRDIRLSRQHDGQRHAQNGDRASQRDKALTAQLRLAFGSPSHRTLGI
jgi:hypothetical protein